MSAMFHDDPTWGSPYCPMYETGPESDGNGQGEHAGVPVAVDVFFGGAAAAIPHRRWYAATMLDPELAEYDRPLGHIIPNLVA